MRKPRGRVWLAWIFCILISGASVYHAGLILAELLAGGSAMRLGGDLAFTLVPPFFAIPAALIITRQPHNNIGWLLMINPLITIPSDLMTAYLSRYGSAAPPATFLNLSMAWFTGLSWMALIFPIVLIPLFFPTGRLLSPRWRWTVYLVAGMTLFLMVFGVLSSDVSVEFADWTLPNPIGIIPEDSINVILPPWSALLGVITVASVTSVIVRYRRGSPVEREQIKWLLYACVLFGLLYLPIVVINTQATQWNVDLIPNLFLPLSIIAIPVAITAAILRYHLFDIDVIIRLTLVYAIVIGLLGLLYLGGIILLQQAFRALSGQNSSAAVVITTLITAVLFDPLRQRIKAIVDRRFFRQKYNAEKALAQFSVAARGSADLDALTEMLVDITQETLQPTEVSLHLIRRM